MPDNLKDSEGAAPTPSSPAEDAKPSAGSGHMTLPPSKKSTNDRLVVALSSVAKTPPPAEPEAVESSKQPPLESVPSARKTEVKLPPKSGTLPKLSPAAPPLQPDAKKENAAPSLPRRLPPPLPAKTPRTTPEETGAPEAKNRTLLKPPALGTADSKESIFADADTTTPPEAMPAGWKRLEAGELPPPVEGLQSLEAFSRSKETAAAKTAPTAPVAKSESAPASKPETAAPRESFPPLPSQAKKKALPPPLPAPKAPILMPDSLESSKPASLSVVPPLAENGAPSGAEKMRLPPPVHETPKEKTLPIVLEKAPALSESGAASHVSSPITVGVPIAEIKPSQARAGSVPPPLAHESSPEITSLKSVPPGVEKIVPPVKPDEKISASSKILETKKEIAPASTSVPKESVPSKTNHPEKTKSPGSKKEPPPPKPGSPASGLAPLPSTGAKDASAAAVTATAAAMGRAARARKRRIVSTVAFYLIFLVVVGLLYFVGVHFSHETRVEGQVIPPPGMLLSNEVWIVNDFREDAMGLADDLAKDRAPKLQEIQERQDHIHRAQADIAAREERIRLIQDQISAAKDQIASMVKQAHDAAQQIWDGPVAALETGYSDRLNELQNRIMARAKSLNLKYVNDDTYHSPEVWANAYRLALYQPPAGVDSAKEHQWIEDQMQQWRAFTKSFDDRKDKYRQQAAQVQLAPSSRVADLNGQIDDLQHRIDSTQAEEDPLKIELQQAQADLEESQTAEAGLDAKYYEQLDALPEQSILKRLPLAQNGRFSWRHLEKDFPFNTGEKAHYYWIFARATRADGRQFWALHHFTIGENQTFDMTIEPGGFISTKSILRPDLSQSDEQ